MKLHLSVDLKKLINEMRGPKGVSALTEELTRISGELKKFRDEVKPQAKAQLKKAEAKGKKLIAKLHLTQKDLDKELKHRISQVKKQAKIAEQNLEKYKKIALAQKKKIQTNLAKKKTSGAKVKTSKKTATRKTSKKAATKA